jgi:hypothetical protein
MIKFKSIYLSIKVVIGGATFDTILQVQELEIKVSNTMESDYTK